jgi:UDP-N-acetylglucosamine 2-epimerase (non-hydrolysing)
MSNFASKHIVHVVGTRPQFPKVAPVWRALQDKCKQTVLHTGQHYDDNMSEQIIEDTGCHIDGVFHGPAHCRQAWVEQFLRSHHADAVIVYGDCDTTAEAAKAVRNSTRAKLAHVEAGLRCGDLNMKEEANRILVDSISDILYAPSADAQYNLLLEGRSPFDIELVGNVMADSYRWACNKYGIHRPAHIRITKGLMREVVCDHDERQPYGLVTMHRPENVDNPEFLLRFMLALDNVRFPFVFPKHPRVTLPFIPSNVTVVDPMSYKDMLVHLNTAQFIVTDSGGLQEEATLAGVPCMTMRPSTERPITITEGTNELSTPETLVDQVLRARGCYPKNRWKTGHIPTLWDGHTGERIAWHLENRALAS